MPFVELDPLLAWKAIEGYQNELAAEQKTLDAFYRQFKCPCCQGPCRRETLSNHAFADPNTMSARSVLRCELCSALFDPHSGIRLEMGDPARVIPITGRGAE